ncbi:MAG: TetR/AcrR family transcriptional regulator [Acidimicrobiales bacterium]
MPNYRARRRRAAMRETQTLALELFVRHGFDSVTVEDVAEAAAMSASTIYRHFDTKEGLVLWHEFDQEVDAALATRLPSHPPLTAILLALQESLAARWDDDPFQLQRVQFIYATEALHAAAVEQDFRDREELAAALEGSLSRKQRANAPLLAGAALLAVDVAIDRWQATGGRPRLGTQLERAFASLGELATLR